jgi:chemotaxis protein MotB
MANSAAEDTDLQTEGKNSVTQAYEEQSLAESEQMAEEIQAAIEKSGLKDQVDVDFTSEYVELNLSGAILFESGKAELVSDALPIIDKIGKILDKYNNNIIEVEGHTDNVPIHSSRYESNEVLSMYRALSVTERLRDHTDIDPKYIKFAGRGDYVPVADNSTAEGRARNRRVEIKVYNSYNSNIEE